jgi:cytochrome b6-f complex iron-sulfur subunit
MQSQPAAGSFSAPLPRRLLLRWIAWGSLSLVLAGWANGFLSFFYPRKAELLWRIDAGGVDDLQIGEVKPLVMSKLFLSRVPEGFLALRSKCTHLGCTLTWRQDLPAAGNDTRIAQYGRIFCPCHEAQFDRYGRPTFGPAPWPLDRFPLSIVNGRVIVSAIHRWQLRL